MKLKANSNNLNLSEPMRRGPKIIEIRAAAGPTLAPAKRMHSKRSAPPFLEAAELDRLFRAISSPRDNAIFRVAYHAGLRASEVKGLQMRDYNASTGRIFIRRLKGSNSGEHYLCDEEDCALKAWLKIRGCGPGPIFVSRSGRGISRQRLDVLMKRYSAAAKIPLPFRHFHMLKHTCATHLLSKGFHLEQVQDWMGHASIQNTRVYAVIDNSRRNNPRRGEMAAQLYETWH